MFEKNGSKNNFLFCLSIESADLLGKIENSEKKNKRLWRKRFDPMGRYNRVGALHFISVLRMPKSLFRARPTPEPYLV